MRSSGFIAAIAIACLCLYGCATDKSGCLDVGATNFQVDADEACSDCCTYPQVRLDLLHKFRIGDSLYNFVAGNDLYPDGAGNVFRLRDFRFYISELRLLRSDGSEVALEEQLALRRYVAGSDSILLQVENNVAIATPASLGRIVLGTFRQGGVIEAVRFKIGVDAPARDADPASAPSAHPLNIQAVPMWSAAQGYLSQRMEVETGVPPDTMSRLLEYGGAASVQTLTLNMPQPLEAPKGFHISLTIRIDYAVWLRNVNLVSDTAEDVFRKIADNLPNSFTVTSITASRN